MKTWIRGGLIGLLISLLPLIFSLILYIRAGEGVEEGWALIGGYVITIYAIIPLIIIGSLIGYFVGKMK